MIRLCRTCVVATGTLEAQDSPMRLVRIYVKCVQGYTDLWILDIDPGGVVVIFAKKQEKSGKKIISNGRVTQRKFPISTPF